MKKSKIIVCIVLLTVVSAIIGIMVNRTLHSNDEREKVTIHTPDGILTSGYADFEEYSEDITKPDSDGMPNRINASDTIIDSGNNKSYTYCGNKNSKVYHLINCTSLKKTKEENKVYFSNKEECINKGYKPCSRCNP